MADRPGPTTTWLRPAIGRSAVPDGYGRLWTNGPLSLERKDDVLYLRYAEPGNRAVHVRLCHHDALGLMVALARASKQGGGHG